MNTGKHYAKLLHDFGGNPLILTNDELRELRSYLTVTYDFFQYNGDKTVANGIGQQLIDVNAAYETRGLS